MKKILTIVGARPQFIKAAAISRAIQEKYHTNIEEVIIHTGQHYDQEMSEVFFNELNIPRPKQNLNIGSGNHGHQTGEMMIAIEKVIQSEQPDAVLVYGDTNSTLAGALAASKLHIPVFHVEAGLRSFNKEMPEEINRIMTDHVSTLLFSPTQTGIENLLKEGISENKTGSYTIDNPGVILSGDIMYDNTLFFAEKANKDDTIFSKNKINKNNYLLATVHRPANTDDEIKLSNIISSFIKIAKELNTQIVFPVHPRTRKSLDKLPQELLKQLTDENGIILINSVSFLRMIQLESNARLVLTDSGGVQKEAWFMEKPVVILRPETEWTEIVSHGNGVLADTSPELIYKAASEFLNNPPTIFPQIYGDGRAASKVLDAVCNSQWY